MINHINFISLASFLREQQVSKLYELALTCNEFHTHQSSTSGKKSALQFLNISDEVVTRATIMKMDPLAVQDWHVDGKRSTVLIYPLSPAYQPGQVESGYYYGPVLLNVKTKHAVFNNNAVRMNFQVAFDTTIDKIDIEEEIDLIKNWIFLK